MKRFGFAIVLLTSVLVGARDASASTVTLYNFMPSPVPGNVVSEGYECCQIDEFGQGISLASFGSFSNVNLSVLMSNWALESTYEPVGTSLGFNVPMTATIYALNPDNSVGGVIGTVTTLQLIAWRPESDPSCTPSSNPSGGWLDANGHCWSGQASTVSFNFGSLLLPQSVAVGIAYNTFSGGYSPTGVHTGADSLNVGLNNGGSPSVGGNVALDTAYLAGPGLPFGPQAGWDPYSAGLALTGDVPDLSAVPEPASLSLLGIGLVGLAVRLRRSRRS